MTAHEDDFSPLDQPEAWLEWLGEDPQSAIRRQIERMLQEQVSGSSLRWVRLQGSPTFLTGGKKTDDGARMLAVRAGMAAAFKLAVRAPDGTEHILEGVFSWVAAGLDGAHRKDRTHLDLDVDPAKASDDLMLRIYDVAGEKPPSP